MQSNHPVDLRSCRGSFSRTRVLVAMSGPPPLPRKPLASLDQGTLSAQHRKLANEERQLREQLELMEERLRSSDRCDLERWLAYRCELQWFNQLVCLFAAVVLDHQPARVVVYTVIFTKLTQHIRS